MYSILMVLVQVRLVFTGKAADVSSVVFKATDVVRIHLFLHKFDCRQGWI